MKLVYTPRSHFSRKVRILLACLGHEIPLVDAGNVADRDPARFGDNPLMSVPVLVDDDGSLVFDSDHIAQQLVHRLDPQDRYDVLTRDVATLNGRAVMNGIMAAEVDVVLAKRTGMDVDRYARFAKRTQVIAQGLDWLEARADALFGERPSYAGFHLVAMWDHLRLYGLLDGDRPRLRERAAALSADPIVAASAPS